MRLPRPWRWSDDRRPPAGRKTSPPAAIRRADQPVPLSELRPGERGRLCTVRLDPEHAERVRALGLHESCDLRLCRSSGACIVQVLGGGGSGCRIALDRELARDVLVTPLTRDGRPIDEA